MLRTCDIVVDEFESKDKAEIGQKKTDRAKGWDLDPKKSCGWGELHIRYLPDYGGDGCHGFGEDIPRFGGMIYVGSCSADSSRVLASVHFQIIGKWTYLSRRIVLWMMLKMAAIPTTTTTPYQKYLANAFPEICKALSSRISPRKSIAWVAFEKSTPEAFKAEEESPPTAGMDIEVSILRNVKTGIFEALEGLRRWYVLDGKRSYMKI